MIEFLFQWGQYNTIPLYLTSIISTLQTLLPQAAQVPFWRTSNWDSQVCGHYLCQSKSANAIMRCVDVDHSFKKQQLDQFDHAISIQNWLVVSTA